MLSYRHIFHAGNHADILKHSVLTLILEHLNAKDKPYTVIDTHAGAGLYDLTDARAQKTEEAERGIKRLIELDDSVIPKALRPYINFVRECDKNKFYPGSPVIENNFMRKEDCQILCELHNNEIDILKTNMRNFEHSKQNGTHAQVHHRNGFEALAALTPPAIKRGLVLTDPSFEEVSDFENSGEAFCKVHEKWPSAILALWYPLLARRRNEIEKLKTTIYANVKTSAVPCDILDIQLCVNTADSHVETELSMVQKIDTPRLYGSGMLIINAPWKLSEKAESFLPFLVKQLAPETGSFKLNS